MSDMEGFLGKVVKDSIDDANKFSGQMDGLKLIGQRQINISQQEQISEDRKWIRELEAQIKKLQSELNSEKRKNESSNSGPDSGWARITEHNGIYYRGQSPEGYKKEVSRLQNNILSLNFSLIFKKINLKENIKHLDLLSTYMNIPRDIIDATRRIGTVKYIYKENRKEFIDEIIKNENQQVSFFLNDRADLFDLMNFNSWKRAFHVRWLISTLIDEEEKILQYLRLNPDKKEEVKLLLGDCLPFLEKEGIHFDNPFTPSLYDLKLLIRIQTIVEASRLLMQRYQRQTSSSEEATKKLYDQAKIDILDDNLTYREKNIYEFGLNENIRKILKAGNLEFFNLPNNIETKEDLDRFNYNSYLLRLEHRALKKVIVYYVLKDREMNPNPPEELKKLENNWERKYRDNDIAREALETLADLSEQMSELKSKNKFNYPFMRSLDTLIYCLSDQFILDGQSVISKREQEYNSMLVAERQEKYDAGLDLLKVWLKNEKDIKEFLVNLEFNKNGKIKLPEKLIDPIHYIISSDATIPHVGSDFAKGVKESDDPTHKIRFDQATYVIGGYIKFLKSIINQYKVTLVASENINIGGIFSKKYVKDIYVKFEFDLHSEEYIKANNWQRFEKICTSSILINGKELKVNIDLTEDASGYLRSPNIIYYKVGQYSIEDEIKSLDIAILQTPNAAMHKDNPGPFNKKFIFNQKVDEIPLIPPIGKICSEKIVKQQNPEWGKLSQEVKSSTAFTNEELNQLSQGLRKLVPRNNN